MRATQALTRLALNIGPGPVLASFLPGIASGLSRCDDAHDGCVRLSLRDLLPCLALCRVALCAVLRCRLMLTPRVVLGDFKQGHALFVAALGAWARIISIVMADVHRDDPCSPTAEVCLHFRTHRLKIPQQSLTSTLPPHLLG